MTKQFLMFKILDLKFEIRMDEIKYLRAVEDGTDAVAADYLTKINISKNMVRDLVKQLNSGAQEVVFNSSAQEVIKHI